MRWRSSTRSAASRNSSRRMSTGLHQRAGSLGAIELHGNVHRVTCLVCGAVHPRAVIQQTLERQNARFICTSGAVPSADGDADPHGVADPHALEGFVSPACEACNGTLKPDVVFFGECVPRDRVESARAALECADAMLVVGSSLMVYSGYRFCEWAVRMGKPLAAINLGRTRADPLLALKLERQCGETLTALVAQLTTEDWERDAACDLS
jgi:NAD-dependent SIR2 family protein deacetylase